MLRRRAHWPRCLSCFLTVLVASCALTSEQQAPQPAPPQPDTSTAQVYAVETPEINAVEALDVEAAGRVVLGQNRLDQPVYLSHYDNKVVLVNYWTSQCESCWQHMADLYRVYTEFKNRGLVVVNVNYGETVQTTRNYLTRRDPSSVTIQLSDRSGQATEAQGVVSVPAAVLYAPDRRVLARYANDFDVERIRRDLSAFLK